MTLDADYARRHVRLGYAGTAHGHQADTVDVSLTLVTEATSHRSLYVGATRGRNENQLFVVTDEPDHARDVLERVLTNERADVPAVVQRRNLAGYFQRTRATEDAVAAARRGLDHARWDAEPFLEPLRAAEAAARSAEAALRQQQAVLANAPRWRCRGLRDAVHEAYLAYSQAQERLDSAERAAAPHAARIQIAEAELHRAERDATTARVRDRLDRLTVEPRARGIGRHLGIEL